MRSRRERLPMTAGPMDPGQFDQFFARLFGGFGQRQPMRVDVIRLLTDQSRALLQQAAEHAMETGSPDLDAMHLLWAATQDPTARRLLQQAGADPDALARQVDQRLERAAAPTAQVPALTPSAKRALLDAHRVSRAFG